MLYHADIDECTSGGHNCDSTERATCTNTIGSYLCSCKEGYLGDRKSCIFPPGHYIVVNELMNINHSLYTLKDQRNRVKSLKQNNKERTLNK